jgi:hypothetical protein
MGNRENTAINELIARASGGPSTEASPEARSVEASVEAQGSARMPEPRLGALQDRNPMHTTYPASMPVAAPFEPQRSHLPTSYPVVPRALLGDLIPDPVPPSAAFAPAPVAVEPAADPARVQSWIAPSSPQDWLGSDAPTIVEPPGEHLIGTLQLHRRSHLRAVIKKLVLPIGLLIAAGVVIGGYFALAGESSGSRAPNAAAPAPAVESAPARPAAPVAAEARARPATPPAALAPKPPALVDVRIDSTPGGATVTLVDRGRNQFVGQTPVSVAIDPSREYDVVFSYPNKPSQVEHLDPRTRRRVEVVLGKRAPPDSPPRAVEKAAAPARPERAGEGTLMISSKPPCEIIIDGVTTGLTTPQRSIALSAGNHKVTLVNDEHTIHKTVSVQIIANATEKVIEDLMK